MKITSKLPMCDVCKKLVDRVEIHYDRNYMNYIYKAFCHGEEEKIIIPESVYKTATTIEIIDAFGKKTLTSI